MTNEIKKLTMPNLNNDQKPYRSKIISEKELVSYVEDGWAIVRELKNRRFLIKKQNHTTTYRGWDLNPRRARYAVEY